MAEQVELKIEPSSDRFDPLDDRWLEQVDGFAGELDQELGGVERERRPVDGGKGFDLASIVLSLGSAGAFTATVELVKSWLSRDRSRSVRLSWSETARSAVELKGSTRRRLVRRDRPEHAELAGSTGSAAPNALSSPT
jgi:hypothetical protein